MNVAMQLCYDLTHRYILSVFINNRCTKEKLEHILQEENTSNSPSPVAPIPETISEEELGDEIVLKEDKHKREGEGTCDPSNDASPRSQPDVCLFWFCVNFKLLFKYVIFNFL